jgi:hypothetical protein
LILKTLEALLQSPLSSRKREDRSFLWKLLSLSCLASGSLATGASPRGIPNRVTVTINSILLLVLLFSHAQLTYMFVTWEQLERQLRWLE